MNFIKIRVSILFEEFRNFQGFFDIFKGEYIMSALTDTRISVTIIWTPVGNLAE